MRSSVMDVVAQVCNIVVTPDVASDPQSFFIARSLRRDKRV